MAAKTGQIDPRRLEEIGRNLELAQRGEIGSFQVSAAEVEAYYAEGRRRRVAEIKADATMTALEKANAQLLLIDSMQRFPALLRLMLELDGDDDRRLLCSWWPHVDHIRPHRWLALALFVLATSRDRGPLCDEIGVVLQDQQVVYRGSCTSEFYDVIGRRKPAKRLGISWTTDRSIAERFIGDRVHRFVRHKEGARPLVLRATLDKSQVLGLFGGRGESEVVVDPTTLKKIVAFEANEPPEPFT